MTTTTTNFESIEAVSLDAVIGGCKKGGCSAPPQQQQQQAMNRPPMPMGPPPGDGKVDIAVDVGAQQQQQVA